MLVVLVGVLLYGGTAWLTNSFSLAGALRVQLAPDVAATISIRPGVAVPILFGLFFGPRVGFVTGAVGNLLGDYWSGYLVYPPVPPTGNLLLDLIQGLLLNWQVGNGLMGLIPGWAAQRHRRYFTLREQLRALGFAALGISVGMGFASFTDMWLDNLDFRTALFGYFIPAVLVNLVNAVIIVPIVLFNYERLDLRATNWRRSGLMRRLLIVILVSSALPVALLSVFLANHWSEVVHDATELTIKLGLTILLTLLFTIANAGLVAQNLSRPLLRLMNAAQAISSERFSVREAAELKVIQGKDEVSRLCQIFGEMAEQVILREENLRRQVEELRIEVDQTKKARQVAEITETDYFRMLQEKAEQLRDKGQKPHPLPPLPPGEGER